MRLPKFLTDLLDKKDEVAKEEKESSKEVSPQYQRQIEEIDGCITRAETVAKNYQKSRQEFEMSRKR